jgi:predicted small secreted protein
VELNKASLTYIISADDDGNKFFMPAWVFVEGVELADSDALDITQAVIVDAESGEVVDIIENAKKAGTWQSFD